MSMTPVECFEARAKNTPMPATRRMFEIAAAALREKAEREDPKPLTLEELWQMDGEAVYVLHGDGGHGWAVVEVETTITDKYMYLHHGLWWGNVEPDTEFYNFNHDPKENFGLHSLGWIAYRHKPKEVKHE